MSFPIASIAAFLCALLGSALLPQYARAQSAEALLSNRIVDARDLFRKLLLAAEVREPVDLVFLKDLSVVNGYFAGGCYETLLVGGAPTRAYQSPTIYVSYGALWADRGSDVPVVLGYVLAHEVTHHSRATRSADQSCERGRRLLRAAHEHYLDEEARGRLVAELKAEELEADRGAVRLLTKLGFDGVAMSETALRVMCERMGCPRESPDHPTRDERITAMRDSGIELLLRAISFPLYAREGAPLVGTAFNLKPTRGHVQKVVVTAGHVWSEIFRYRRKAALPARDGEYCLSEDRCVTIKARDDLGLDDVIAYSERDPIDFAYLWGTCDGAQRTRYPAIASGEPAIGEIYYTLGMDDQDRRGLAILEYRGKTDGYLLFGQVDGFPMRPGTSGSPIVNSRREVVGISVRSSEERRTVRATNIRMIIGLADSVIDFASGSSGEKEAALK